MSRALARVVAAVTLAAAPGCFNHVELGPQPVLQSWQPAAELAERSGVEPDEEHLVESLAPLSPDDAALLAVENNPELRMIRQRRGIADAQIVAAGMLANPRIDANVDAPIGGADAVVMGFGVGLSWDIAPLVSRGARIEAANAGRDAVDLEVVWQEWRIAQVARLHAVRLIYLERRVALAGELERAWTDQSLALEAALASSSVTMIEVTAARAAATQARRTRLELEQQRAGEAITLAEAIGLDPSVAVDVDLRWTRNPGGAPVDALIAELPHRRLDLLALQHVHRSHDQGLRAAALLGFPAMEIGVHVNRDADQVAVAGVTLGVEIPSFDRNQGQVAHERARRREVEAEYDARLLLAQSQVARVAAEISALEAALEAAEQTSATSGELAGAASLAVERGAMSSLVALELEQQAHLDRARVLELEQNLAELDVALSSAAGQ
jgi:outer membrane protein TolC